MKIVLLATVLLWTFAQALVSSGGYERIFYYLAYLADTTGTVCPGLMTPYGGKETFNAFIKRVDWLQPAAYIAEEDNFFTDLDGQATKITNTVVTSWNWDHNNREYFLNTAQLGKSMVNGVDITQLRGLTVRIEGQDVPRVPRLSEILNVLRPIVADVAATRPDILKTALRASQQIHWFRTADLNKVRISFCNSDTRLSAALRAAGAQLITVTEPNPHDDPTKGPVRTYQRLDEIATSNISPQVRQALAANKLKYERGVTYSSHMQVLTSLQGTIDTYKALC